MSNMWIFYIKINYKSKQKIHAKDLRNIFIDEKICRKRKKKYQLCPNLKKES
jgi:hypothetical protein